MIKEQEKLKLDLEFMFFTKHGERLGIPWAYANTVDGLADDCIAILKSHGCVMLADNQPPINQDYGYRKVVQLEVTNEKRG